MAEKTIGQIFRERFHKVYDAGLKNPNAVDHQEVYDTAMEAAATAVWNEAVEACMQAIRQHPAAVGESDWDEGVNDARLEHIKALRSLKRSDKENGDG